MDHDASIQPETEEAPAQDLAGKTVVITGSSSGIGGVAARRLAQRGATVVPVGRSPEGSAAVAADVGSATWTVDFTHLDDVRRLAERLLTEVGTIDVLVHNAGGMFSGRRRRETTDGHELTMQVNYLAPFLLQHLLQDRLHESGAHVVVTSSVGHRFGRIDLDDLDLAGRRYSGFRAYGTAKLADLLFAREIARRTPETGITAVAVHPGYVRSGLARESTGPMGFLYNTTLGSSGLVDVGQGAAPLVLLASPDQRHVVNGQYFDGLKPDARTSRRGRDTALGTALWDRTALLLGLPGEVSGRGRAA